MVPSWRHSNVDCSTRRDAVPPIWKVLMVSCVPGSPMACAAITPTASPVETRCPLASKHGANFHFFHTGIFNFLNTLFGHFFACSNQYLIAKRIDYIL